MKYSKIFHIDLLNKVKYWYPSDEIIFANGGDRKKHNTPEQAVCEEIGVEMLWGIGGEDKANSSSDLVERVKVRSKVSSR